MFMQTTGTELEQNRKDKTMTTIVEPDPPYEPMKTIKKGVKEAVAVTGSGALAWATAGAIATAVPAAAPFVPYIIGGFTVLYAAINRCIWNWLKKRDK